AGNPKTSPTNLLICRRWSVEVPAKQIPKMRIGSNRRERVVLDAILDLYCPLHAGKPGDQVQGHVDAGAHSGTRDDVPVVDEPVAHPDVNGWVQGAEELDLLPVRGCRSVGK